MKPFISYKQIPQEQIKKPKLITHRDKQLNTWYAKAHAHITSTNPELSLLSHSHMPSHSKYKEIHFQKSTLNFYKNQPI